MELISYQNVAIQYERGKPVVSDVSFSVEEGTITAILGPNGSGKTTLMSALIGLTNLCSGQIFIGGKDVREMSVRERASLVASVPQFSPASFNYTVYDMIMWGRAPHISYRPREHDHAVVRQTIHQLQLEHLQDKYFNSISGGEKQMVMIARAVAQDTPIILMDEPTTYLDLKNQKTILNLILKLQEEQGITCIVTIHDPNHALYIADHVLMVSGHTAKYGTAAEIMTEANLEELYGVRTTFISQPEFRYIGIQFDN